MSSIRNREAFVRRTKEILERKYDYFKEEEDREVTFLLNCLLGTIVAVSENEKKTKKKLSASVIDGEFLDLIPDKIGFLKNVKGKYGVKRKYDLTNPETHHFDFEVGHKADLKGKEKSWLLNKIRNGIAHLNMEWENELGKCKDIRLWNEPRRDIRDFEIVFAVDELKKLAIELSIRALSPIS